MINWFPVEAKRIERRWHRGQSPREMNRNPRVYVFPKGESVLDNLVLRRSRPVGAFRDVARQAIKGDPELVPNMPVGQPLELRWSQKAGCRCGCSPGFITNLHGQFDIYIYAANDAAGLDHERLMAVEGAD